jgi:hypothetical protein
LAGSKNTNLRTALHKNGRSPPVSEPGAVATGSPLGSDATGDCEMPANFLTNADPVDTAPGSDMLRELAHLLFVQSFLGQSF